CGDAVAALEAIVSLKPDLVFLDVQMPVMNGFEVLDATHNDHRPEVIFVTAHDRYAVRAFEAHALDYLLKPYKRERFHAALARAKERIGSPPADRKEERLDRFLKQIRAETSRLVVRAGGRVLFLRFEEISWVESAGNYVRLHVRAEVHEIRDRLSA